MNRQQLQQLISELQNGSDQQRRVASYKLGKSRDSAAVPALIAAFNDEDGGVHRNVINGLRNIGTREALDFLAGDDNSKQERLAQQTAQRKETRLQRLQKVYSAISDRKANASGPAWEYCQIANTPQGAGDDEIDGYLCFFGKDNDVIEIPNDCYLNVVAELGQAGWEMVSNMLIKSIHYPTEDVRTTLSYVLENTLDTAPRGAIYTYDEYTVGFVIFFKRLKPTSA